MKMRSSNLLYVLSALVMAFPHIAVSTTTSRLLTIDDRNTNLRTEIFNTLDGYARYCCQTYFPPNVRARENANKCKDDALTQMAFYVWIPKTITESEDVLSFLHTNFNPSQQNTHLNRAERAKICQGTHYDLSYPLFDLPSQLNPTRNGNNVHTERRLLSKIAGIGQRRVNNGQPIIAFNYYLYTFNSPCVTPGPGGHSCTDEIFKIVQSATSDPNNNNHSLHVGFKRWFTWTIGNTNNRIPASLSRNYFCYGNHSNYGGPGFGVDGNKWDRANANRINYDGRLSFTKIQKESGDNGFNPGSTGNGERC